jgi:hypothetical protein
MAANNAQQDQLEALLQKAATQFSFKELTACLNLNKEPFTSLRHPRHHWDSPTSTCQSTLIIVIRYMLLTFCSIISTPSLKFNTQDNTGQVRAIRISDSLKHWAQGANDHHLLTNHCIALWNQECKPMRAAPFIKSIITPVGCSSFETQSYRTYSAVIEALRASTQQFCWDQVIQHPDHSLSIPESDKFMADGNLLLHANHCNRPSEGVYNNTVKFSNVASEGATDSSTCTISTVDQDDELTAPVDKAKSMEKIMSFNKPWSSKNRRQPCPKPTFLSMIALAGCLYIYTKRLLPGGGSAKVAPSQAQQCPRG